MGKKKKTGNHKSSSGTRKLSRRNRTMNQLKSKVKRWKRYVAEINSGKKKGSVSRWNTAGLEKQLKTLEAL